MFNQTITIYNQWKPKGTNDTKWYRTVIRGASWSGNQRITLGERLISNDSYSVRIPAKSFPNGYLSRDEYLTLEDPEGYWTAQNGDVVLLGEGADAERRTDIIGNYTDSFVVNAVHTDNMNRLLPHLRLEGQ